MKLYGIPNCDTVRRSRAWLAARGVDAAFHDFRTLGVPPDRAAAWASALGWEALINRSGSTWRRLPEPQRAAVVDAESALALMQAQPSVVRRPVVEWDDGAVTAGFGADAWTTRLDALRGD